MITDLIRKLRLERNLTQEYIAHELEISQNAYCKIENGQVNITVDRLQQIAGVFGVPLSVFMPENADVHTGDFLLTELKHMIGVLKEELQAKQKLVDGLMEVIREISQRKF